MSYNDDHQEYLNALNREATEETDRAEKELLDRKLALYDELVRALDNILKWRETHEIVTYSGKIFFESAIDVLNKAKEIK
jgi:hypothetical protein